MKQIKNKLYKINKEIEFLKDLESASIKAISKHNKNIEKKVDNIQYNCLLVLLPFLVLIIGLLIGNVILTSDLYEQYYIEECTCND